MTDERTALIVDDSRLMQSRIADLFAALGFTTIARVGNGAEAIEQYREFAPSIVTMDIVMPMVHGIDALKTILANDPDANVIVLSGLHHRELLIEALEAGALDYLPKPFTEADFRAVVSKHFDLAETSANGD